MIAHRNTCPARSQDGHSIETSLPLQGNLSADNGGKSGVNEMSDSRAQILNRLRAASPSLGEIETESEHLPVVPRDDLSPHELVDRFVERARQLDSYIHLPSSQSEAIQLILDLLGDEHRVSCWAFSQIPLPGLEEAFTAHGIQVAEGRDATLRVGITGADAALAATGSLVLQTGAGKARLTSLLPPVHIAVIHQNQILIDLEDWITTIRQEGFETFREAASAMIISGPSRTADIAMQTIMGMHGPGELHIIVVEYHHRPAAGRRDEPR